VTGGRRHARIFAANGSVCPDGAGARVAPGLRCRASPPPSASARRKPFTPLVYTVDTSNCERADNRPQIRLYGQVETGRSVDLRAAVSGDVVEIHPDLVAGRRVAEGTVLACASIRLLYEGALVEARANLASTRAAIAEMDARLASEREQLAGCPGTAGTGQIADLKGLCRLRSQAR
jgi:multidrug efflux pump subunit AcrA (membrane-fusion protein)